MLAIDGNAATLGAFVLIGFVPSPAKRQPGPSR
jgi:hypothetical protein